MVDVRTVDTESFELFANVSMGQRPNVKIQLSSLILKNWNNS